jgi:hypothetical protein
MDKSKLNPPELLYLTTFLMPHAEDEFLLMSVEQWRLCLGISPRETNRSLLERGLIEPASAFHHLDKRYTIRELRAILERRGLPPAGNKGELILQLLQNAEGKQIISDVGFTLLQCSDLGAQLCRESLREMGEDESETRSVIQSPSLTQSFSVERIKAGSSFFLGSVVGGVIENSSDRGFQKLLSKVRDLIGGDKNKLVSKIRRLSREAVATLLRAHGCRHRLMGSDEEEELYPPSKGEMEVLLELHSLGFLEFEIEPKKFSALLSRLYVMVEDVPDDSAFRGGVFRKSSEERWSPKAII